MDKPGSTFVKTLFCTVLAMIAFAANSVLCRLALGSHAIDASGFTVIRLLSGAVVLSAILQFHRGNKTSRSRGSWTSGIMLFLYAVAFSFSYVTLDTGTGALILFGSVQITMISMSVLSGYRLRRTEWSGALIALGGFVYLMLPGVTTPSAAGFTLMTVAGIAWGIYSLKGRESDNPFTDTAGNFLRTVPFVIILTIAAIPYSHYTNEGIVLGALSGGITSAIGYIIWYAALRGLSATLAAVVQLSVPVIAALGGVIFMSEAITLRLALSAVIILGGILLVILGRSRPVHP
jgi:drug/metabolite transporter (DMT)-like permease